MFLGTRGSLQITESLEITNELTLKSNILRNKLVNIYHHLSLGFLVLDLILVISLTLCLNSVKSWTLTKDVDIKTWNLKLSEYLLR